MCAGDWRIRLERQHGAYHEGPGSAGQQHERLHVIQEDSGDQPRQCHHAGQSVLKIAIRYCVLSCDAS